MAINHRYFTIQGTTYQPGDITFGEAETLDVVVNGLANGTINTVQLTKRQVTLSAKGIIGAILQGFESLRSANVKALLRNNASTEDLDFGGYLIEQALLKNYTPTAPQIIDGLTHFESVDLVYDSLVFT